MFAKRPENQQAIDRAMEFVASGARGDVFAHHDLAGPLGVPAGSERYYQFVQRLKRRLLDERGIRLVSIPLVGYELATPKGQLEFARGRQVQAARRLRDGHKTVALLPESDCSFTELRAKQAFEEKFAQNEKAMRQDAQRLAFLMRPREQRPRAIRDDEDGCVAVTA